MKKDLKNFLAFYDVDLLEDDYEFMLNEADFVLDYLKSNDFTISQQDKETYEDLATEHRNG